MKTMYAMVMVMLLGCGRQQTAEGSNDGAAPVIGVSMLSLQNEFVVNVKDAMVASAKKNNITLVITDAQRSAEKQVQQVESFIAQGVDAIIVNPCEVEASSPAIEKAKSANIPIINVNSETRVEPDAFIGSRDEEASKLALEFIAEKINNKGNIVIMDGYMGQAAQIKRSAGAKTVLAKYPGIKVLAEQTAEWDRAKAMSLMENWIQLYGNHIDAVFAHNDEMGLGALQAVEQAGLKNKIIIVSIDAIDDAIKAVKEGRLDATIYQDAKGQGEGAIDIASRMIKKEKVQGTKIYIPFQLITKENVGELLAK